MLKFGTDGVRGEFGTELTTTYVAALARAVAKVLRCKLVVIGRDTRESGPVLEQAIAQALIECGVEVHLMGVAPTPAIAHAAATGDLVAFAITASHNAYTDNGVKIFGNGGRKLSDDEQSRIEIELLNAIATQNSGQSVSQNQATFHPKYLAQYCAVLIATAPKNALVNLKIALDCANGAMSSVAPEVFAALGATVSTIHTTPNGKNINDNCGATHPVSLSESVKNLKADLGIAFDGDGDRLIATDNDGLIVDGDHLLAISAKEMKRTGTLRNNKVVVTVMTNIGFHQAMQRAEIEVITTPVGDRAVLAAIEENDLALGGEQSGHIIYSDQATTGDGLLAAIRLAVFVASSSLTLSEIASEAMTSFPQVLINVRIAKSTENIQQIFAAEILQAQKTLADNGRVLVRSSGTEPVVRVMVEAAQHETAKSVATALADAIAARLS